MQPKGKLYEEALTGQIIGAAIEVRKQLAGIIHKESPTVIRCLL